MKINIDDFKKECSCGKNHNIFVKDIIIEENAIKKLPQLMKSETYTKYKRICVICDDNTYIAAGEEVISLIQDCKYIKLNPDNLHANEKGVEMVLKELNYEIDLLVAVGSGTIHDLTRYVAFNKGVEFISVPTAASVDGFVSTVAAMTWKGCKKTFEAVSPIAVIADSVIFAKAPYRLTASGISDLLGKYIAITDWKISNIVTGEYICNEVCNLELEALNKVCGNIEEIREGKLEACEQLMYALLLSGLAMQMIGNSRPASGAEHHFAHLWEMEIINEHIDAYHGEKVSVGLMICVDIYNKVNELIKNNEIELINYNGVEFNFLKETIKNKEIYEELVKENNPDPLLKVSIEKLSDSLKDISKVLSEIPSVEEIERITKIGGCKETLKDVGLDEGIINKSIKLSPYVRNRLTFMRMCKLIKLGI